MTLRPHAHYRLALLPALLLLVSCDGDTPNAPQGPPVGGVGEGVIETYAPAETILETFIDDTIEFKVVSRDPDATVEFTLDGDAVAEVFSWSYVVTAAGPVTVRATVTSLQETESVQWELQRFERHAPAIEVVSVAPSAEVPAELMCKWYAAPDTRGEPLVRYWVRSLDQPIVTEADWDRAQTHATPGQLEPGSMFEWTLRGLDPEQTVYVSVRGVDEYAHPTQIGESVQVTTLAGTLRGRILDVDTGEPLGGAFVRFMGSEVVTLADGAYSFEGLSAQVADLRVTDDNEEGVIGVYHDFRLPYTPRVDEVKDIYLMPYEPAVSQIFPDFLSMFLHFTKLHGVPNGLLTNRWQIPVDVYVPPMVRNDIDYQATLLDVLTDLEAVFERDLFTIVGSPPTAGVTIKYVSNLRADNYGITEFEDRLFPKSARIEFRDKYYAAVEYQLVRVARHEFGHMLGLNHSADLGHIMIGGTFPYVQHLSVDERLVISRFYNLPRGFETFGYIYD